MAKIRSVARAGTKHRFVTLNMGDADVELTHPGVQRARHPYLKTYEKTSTRQRGEL